MTLLCANTLSAAPYQPLDDNHVVARLTVKVQNSQDAQLIPLRKALLKTPNNAQIATTLANKYIQWAQQRHEPVYYQYAAAVLAPWEGQANTPNRLRLPRAMVYQHQHRFTEALADLNHLLRAQPRNVPAWFLRSSIAQVVGDYPLLRQSCAALLTQADALYSTICLSSYASLTGRLERAYKTLHTALQHATGADVRIRRWAWHMLANMAVRQGEPALAEAHFTQALSLDPNNPQILVDYADFMLAQQGDQAVIDKLSQYSLNNNALRLRWVLANRASRTLRQDPVYQQLQRDFQALAARGSETHLRERGLFFLQVLKQPDQALSMAKRNWAQLQREPEDALLLIKTAVAANDAVTVQQVRRWITATGLEDARIQRWLAIVGDKP